MLHQPASYIIRQQRPLHT